MQPSKSHFENVLTILPQGHDEALKKAFYNIASLLFVVIVSAIAISIYYIMHAFLRPLLWALLCGTFLFPFKNHLATTSKRWLNELSCSGTPLCIGVFFLPFNLVNSIFDHIIETCWYNKKVISLCCICVLSTILGVHFWPIPFLTRLLFIFLDYSGSVINVFSSYWIWSMVVGFLVILLLWPSDSFSMVFKIISTFLWIIVIFNITSMFSPPFLIVLTLFFFLLALIGVFSELDTLRKSQSVFEEEEVSIEDSKEPDKSTSQVEDLTSKTKVKPVPSCFFSRSDSSVISFPNRSFSDSCLLVVIWSLLLIHLFVYTFLLSIIPYMAVLVVLKILCNYLEVGTCIRSWVYAKTSYLRDQLRNPQGKLNIVLPKHISLTFNAVCVGDAKVIKVIEGGMDKISSALIILILLLSILFVTVFSGLEVHKESMHLVKVSGNLFNKTQHPTLSEWLPDDDVMRSAVDSMANNAYLYGREWIVNQLKGFVRDGGDNEHQNIEKQVLKLWDTLYNSWINKDSKLGLQEAFALRILNQTGLPTLKQKLQHYRPSLTNFIRDNFDPLLNLMKSVWSVLVSNIALSLNLLASIVSIIFGGGTAILNTVLSLVIFLTTLFYLLASSGVQYKPVEILSSLGLSQSNEANKYKFGKAVQDAIGSVFLVSLKMGAFYGLYTWLTHVVFGVQIIFIPSAVAALFAVVPFVGTYVASLPGVVELWLIQGQPIHALLLFLAHYLPTFFIDTLFYSEIKGGHPLLTGLAIIGGMYWMGLEGAIIGPVLLCCFVVAMHMYQNMMRSV